MGKFKGIPNLNGRPKGSKNKTTAQTKVRLQELVSKELDNFDKMLGNLEPKERMEIIIKILPFVLPKQTHLEIEENDTDRFKPITVTLINEPLQIVNESSN